MKKKNKKKKRKKNKELKKGLRLFPKLMISFVIFSFLTIFAFALSLLITWKYISMNSLTDSSSDYSIFNSEGEIKDLSNIYSTGGWIEVLDSDYNIIQIYGEKQTSLYSYSAEDLIELSSLKEDKDPDYCSIVLSENDEYYLVIVPTSSVMQIFPYAIVDDNENEMISNALTTWFAVFVFLFFTLCFVASLALIKQIKNPLAKITDGIRQMKNGNKNVQLNFKTNADFAEIRDDFNDMVNEIEKQKTEKIEAESKRDRLLLDLSHDIRTPVATLKSCAVALNEHLVEEEKLDTYYKIMSDKTDQILSLSESLFTMLKMENSEYIPTTCKTDFCEYARKKCSEFYDDIESSGLSLDVDIPESPIFVDIDVALIDRVIDNLIFNAIKYNQTGGKILLQLTEKSSAANFSVSDDGTLIASEDIPQLFDAFARGDKARSSKDGTGLGLPIAKAIIEKHHGNIKYYVNSGNNCFSFTLPLCQK